MIEKRTDQRFVHFAAWCFQFLLICFFLLSSVKLVASSTKKKAFASVGNAKEKSRSTFAKRITIVN